MVIDAGGMEPTISPLEQKLLSYGADCRMSVRGGVRLSEGAASPKSVLRKSYRSLVNWGERNLSYTRIDANNPDRDLFQDVERFHERVAGRKTRSAESWDAQFEAVAAGDGLVLVAELPGHGMVGATICIDSASVRMYWSGIYDRDMFDKSISHGPVFASIMDASHKGCHYFDLGDIPFASECSDKEFKIGQFKKGFASELAARRIWTLTLV